MLWYHTGCTGFLHYMALGKFTPGTVSAYMPAILPCCGAACCFCVCAGSGARFNPYNGSVWCNGVLCVVTFPAVWCVSRRRSLWFTFLYGAFTLYLFPVVFQAARSLFRGLRSCSQRSCSFMVVTVPGGVLSFQRVPGHVPRIPVRVLLPRLPRCYPSSVPGAGTAKPRRVLLRSGACLPSFLLP